MNHHETRGTITGITDIKTSGQILSHHKKSIDTSFKVGGLISDPELAWLYNGPHLKVISTLDGTIQSSWDFSSITRDNKTEITCVIEYEASEHGSRQHYQESLLCLIVGYTSQRDANKASYISFCHPRTSKILHTVTTREKITCLSLITSKKDHSCPITGIVKLMSGALAIGTKSGNLLIMDIKGYDLLNEAFSSIRKSSLSDLLQNRSSCMLILDIKHYNESEIKEKICKVDDDNYHVAISILVSDKRDAQKYDLNICSLKYIPEGLTLAIGFQSGVFQLWDIPSLKRMYKSSSLMVPTPIVKFGFQEPCNDPQNFCYLWVIHESIREDESCLPFAVMYGVLYKKVVTSSEYGRYYKNFVHCKKRFDMDIDMERSLNGRCISCSVVSNTPSNILRHINLNEEDPSKINLFVMVFETWEHHSHNNSHISLVVFDMNQWYKAQMPHQCYNGYSVPFVNFVLLDRVSEKKSSLLDMRIKKDSIQQFLTFNLSEEYSYPSSLSFDTIFLTQNKIINLRIPGVQRCIIEQIVAEGPTCLINPSKYYTECKDAGLRPCFSDNYGHIVIPSQIQQRNYVLTILLEHKMSSFLVRCVKEWADGSRAVSGCTLPHLIQWIWDCVTRIKQLTDVICIPLFDYSGDDLDRENYQKLKHCCQLLHLIRDLLLHILKNYKHYLLDSKKLNHQVETLQLVTKYFDVIIWCLDVGMLPEKVTSSSDRCIPTYMISLMQYAEQRREELKNIVLKDRYFLNQECTLYIIDSILENEEGGKVLRQQWERESCGLTNGYYPPVTLQSLLRMFLMPNLSTDVKHFIMMYFLLDVCDYHRDEDMKEQLMSFSVVFFSDTKFLNLVKACWYLDHEKFDEAADLMMTSPIINLLKKNKNIYETILKSCVCQSQYGLALKCDRIIELSPSFKNKSFYITLLLLNGLIMEAYTTLRKNGLGQKQLLQNFFKVCDELGYLKEIFKFPLLPEEEKEFIEYLNNSDNKDSGDLKIIYLLSRGRYVEAVDINHNMGSKIPKYGIIGNDTTKQENTGRTTTRDLLVNAFSKTLPRVTNDLMNICRKEKDKIYRHKQVTKPTPLSMVVHVDTEKKFPVYKSSLETVMQAAISKTVETWNNFPKFDRNNKNISLTQFTPFLRTEIMTPKRKKSDMFKNFVLDDNFKEKKDVDEPPTKRRRKSVDISLADVTEVEEEDGLQSASLEVTKILRTPHVQKRLNKLLENTPESSPLTSILKSSDISRFKQPQKVGFNVPEVRRRTPHRKSVSSASVGTSTMEDISVGEKKAMKILDFDHLNETSFEKNNMNVDNFESDENSIGLNKSEDKEKEDSYYSLESSHESDNMMNFILENSKAEENTITSSKVIIECMSEEDSINMSQTENFHVQKTNAPEFCVSLPPSSVSQVSHAMEIKSSYSISAVEQTENPTNLEFTSSEFIHDVHSIEEKEEQRSDYGEEENQQKENIDHDLSVDVSSCQDSESDDGKESAEEEISGEEYESRELDLEEEEEEEQEPEHEQEPNSSVTEVSCSSNEEDSDVEIIEDNTVPMVMKTPENQSKLGLEEEQLSEKTYESDYSYSDDSVEEDPETEEQFVAEEENVYVDDSNESVEYEENEVEYEEEKAEKEEEQQQKPEYEISQIDYQELKNIMSSINAAEAENNKIENEDEPACVANSTVNESVQFNESVSVCEVFDSTPSVIEETVNLSDMENSKIVECTQNETVEISEPIDESETCDKSYSIVNVSNVTDLKMENLPQTEIADNEPPLVFYFGENSVTSIGEDMLIEERDVSSSKTVSEKNDEPKLSENTQEIVTEEVVSRVKCSPMKGHDFLKTSVPECNIHIIEKVRNEMYSSDDGYDDSDVQNDPTPEEIPQLQSVQPPQKAGDIDMAYVRIVEKVSDDAQKTHEINVTYDVETTHDTVEKNATCSSKTTEINVTYRVETCHPVDHKKVSNVSNLHSITKSREDDFIHDGEVKKNQNKTFEVVEASATYDIEEARNGTPCRIAEEQNITNVEQIQSQQRSSPSKCIENDTSTQNENTDVTCNIKDEQNATISCENLFSSNQSSVTIIEIGEKFQTTSFDSGKNSNVDISVVQLSQLPQTQTTEVSYRDVGISAVESDSVKVSDKDVESSIVSVKNRESVSPVQLAQPYSVSTPSSLRRSSRIARRSIDCIPSMLEREKEDDSSSIKSGNSVANSVVSKASVESASSVSSYVKRKKSMTSRRSMNKSVNPLEIIVSDEEMASPQKIPLPRRRSSYQPKYAASEPGNDGRLSVKRKRIAKSEHGDVDDDRLSSISEASGRELVYKKNIRRKSDLNAMNEGMLKTPTPAKTRRLGKFISSTPLKENKSNLMTEEIEKYASSRRLTRSQKSYMEYGFINRGDSNLPSGVLPTTSHQSTIVEKLDNIEEEDSGYSLTIDQGLESDGKSTPIQKSPEIQPVPIGRRITPKKNKPSLPSRFSRRLSGRFEQQSNDDSLSSEEPPSPAKSVSSVAESTSSRASTASRKSQIRRRSFSNMELRRSSVRPQFKPLAVIASDDESPDTPLKNVNESILSSEENSQSVQTRRSKKVRTESDRESSFSDVSVSSKKKIGVKEKPSEESTSRRSTRSQKNKTVRTQGDSSKRKKK